MNSLAIEIGWPLNAAEQCYSGPAIVLPLCKSPSTPSTPNPTTHCHQPRSVQHRATNPTAFPTGSIHTARAERGGQRDSASAPGTCETFPFNPVAWTVGGNVALDFPTKATPCGTRGSWGCTACACTSSVLVTAARADVALARGNDAAPFWTDKAAVCFVLDESERHGHYLLTRHYPPDPVSLIAVDLRSTTHLHCSNGAAALCTLCTPPCLALWLLEAAPGRYPSMCRSSTTSRM